MASNSTLSNCGIRVAASARSATREAVQELKAELYGASLQHIIVFFGIDHDAELLAAALSEAFPGIPVSGCSTAGEIGPSGMMQGALVLIAFPREGFRVHSELITDIDRFGVERATDAARRLKAQVSPPSERLHPEERICTAAGRWSVERRGEHRRGDPLGDRRHRAHRRLGG